MAENREQNRSPDDKQPSIEMTKNHHTALPTSTKLVGERLNRELMQ